MARSAASWPPVTELDAMRADAIQDLERIKYGQICVNLFQNGPHSLVFHIHQSFASSLELLAAGP